MDPTEGKLFIFNALAYPDQEGFVAHNITHSCSASGPDYETCERILVKQMASLYFSCLKHNLDWDQQSNFEGWDFWQRKWDCSTTIRPSKTHHVTCEMGDGSVANVAIGFNIRLTDRLSPKEEKLYYEHLKQ